MHHPTEQTLPSSDRQLLTLAFFLPQFHRIPENDEWWEPGFTEWTHLQRARPFYDGHRIRQPVSPEHRYDLTDPQSLEAHDRLARDNGIDGFLVWDYWLGGGRRLLDRPLQMALEHDLDFRYAIAWANHSWRDQLRRRVLAVQHYLGSEDYAAYFVHCLPHFRSRHYILVDGKPLFFVYRPEDIPDLERFVSTWRTLAHENGFPGIFLVGDRYRHRSPYPTGFDAVSCGAGFWSNRKKLFTNLVKERLRIHLGIQTSPQRYDFSTMVADFIPKHPEPAFVPTIMTGWDTTPRHGRNGVIFEGLNRTTFRRHLEAAGDYLLHHAGPRLLLIKSWNEWAEGNLLEPDSIFGDELLSEFRTFARDLRSRLTKQAHGASING